MSKLLTYYLYLQLAMQRHTREELGRADNDVDALEEIGVERAWVRVRVRD